MPRLGVHALQLAPALLQLAPAAIERRRGQLAGAGSLARLIGRGAGMAGSPEQPPQAIGLQRLVGPGVGFRPGPLQRAPEGVVAHAAVAPGLEGVGEYVQIPGLVELAGEPLERRLGPLLAVGVTEHRDGRAPAAQRYADLVQGLGRARPAQPRLEGMDVLDARARDQLQRMTCRHRFAKLGRSGCGARGFQGPVQRQLLEPALRRQTLVSAKLGRQDGFMIGRRASGAWLRPRGYLKRRPRRPGR